jgi:hypothetical protein
MKVDEGVDDDGGPIEENLSEGDRLLEIADRLLDAHFFARGLKDKVILDLIYRAYLQTIEQIFDLER